MKPFEHFNKELLGVSSLSDSSLVCPVVVVVSGVTVHRSEILF
jgi:hypothetical protein